MKADLVFYGGTIRTFEPELENPEALAARDGKIVALGRRSDLEQMIGPDTRRVNLEGRALLPGFNDAHVHVWKVGQLRTTSLDLRDVRSIVELRERVQERAASLEPGVWLLGRGYNEAKLTEGRMPTRADLDDIAPHNPVLLTRTCAHIHTVNSRALELANLTRDSSDPPGGELGRDAGGDLNGILFEAAFGLVTRAVPAFTIADYERWVTAGLEYLASFGITSATDPAVDPVLYQAYRNLEARGALPIRVNLLYIRRPDGGKDTFPLPEKHVSNWLRCDSVKFFADGGLSGATAAVSVPYRNLEPGAPAHGVLRFETEEFFELTLEAHQAGFRIGTHGIGDRALDQILEVYTRLHEAHPTGLRHRIEHFGLPSAQHLETARRLNLIAVPQPIFLHELRENFLRYLPDEFKCRCYALKSMMQSVTTAFSSDGPVVADVNPLNSLRAAMNEPMCPGEEVSLEAAWRAFTITGAIAQGDEDNRGTLRVGKHADMIVMNSDPFSTPFDDWKLERVFVGGKERPSTILEN